jgi:hypothetical protein
MRCRQIPCYARNRQILSQFQWVTVKFPERGGTGNFSARTGNFFGGTGNSISLIGSVETLYRSGSNTWFPHFRAERSEGSPDSIPDGMDSGFAARSRKPDLAAPRNDIWLTHVIARLDRANL